MKQLLIYFLFIGFTLISSNCSNPPKDKPSKENHAKASDSGDNLTEIYWKLTEIYGKAVTDYPAQNKEPYLLFKKEDNRVEGTGGCNSLGGVFELKGENQIRFSQMTTTKMACPDMMMEADFHAALEVVETYQTDGKILTFTNKVAGTTAKFEASTR